MKPAASCVALQRWIITVWVELEATGALACKGLLVHKAWWMMVV
jgi:hypothetical protein